MEAALHENGISGTVVLDPESHSDESLLKKVLTALLSVSFGSEAASKLYHRYATSFALFASKIPFQRPHNMPNGSNQFPKPAPEKIGLGRSAESVDDFDVAIKRNHDRQEEISSNMLDLTRSLKATTMAANHLIKRDIHRLNQSKNSAEGNMEALKQTSEKLTACSRNSMNWSLIFLVVLVFMIFMFMVFLMRILKKN